MKLRFALASAVATALLVPQPAHADKMDIALSRLKLFAQEGSVMCPASSGGGAREFCPDNDKWRRLISQFGAAIAPPVMSGARTVGPGGFELSFDAWFTGIDSSQLYWQQGTEGDREGATEACEGVAEDPDTGQPIQGCNRFVNDVMHVARVQVKKGFPFGFELAASAAKPFNTSYWVWGFGLKWSLFEGFHDGAWQYLPDFAVRGMVNTMTGDGQFNLTVPSVDATISKPLVAGDTVVFTPYFATQLMWIVGDSELVDLTPDRNAFDECMPVTGPPGSDATSTVQCPQEGDPADFNNNAVFADVRARRWRLAFGLRLRYQILTITSAFHFDAVKPGDADGSVSFDEGPELPRQWTISLGAGLQI